VSKKLEEKQRRRLAEERKRDELHKAARRRNLTTSGVALLVAAGVVTAIVMQRQAEEGPAAAVGVSERQAGCTGVQEHEEMGATHIDVGAPHEPYGAPAPTSGPHYAGDAGPVDPGFYEEPIPPEGAIHNLEHGMIVIWYSPDAPEEEIANIEEITDQERFATVALPYPGLQTDKNFVLTAWTVSQECDQVSQDVVDEFRRNYQGKLGPEPLTDTFEG
jgi:hypothetical protein